MTSLPMQFTINSGTLEWNHGIDDATIHWNRMNVLTDTFVIGCCVCVCLTDDEVEPEEIEEVDEFEPKKSKGTINIEFDTGDVSDKRQLQDENGVREGS